MPGDPGDCEHVSLVEGVRLDEFEGLRLHDHAASGDGLALGVGLPAHVHHLSIAALVYVSKPGFA